MAYNKKMAGENKAIFARAAELLPATGWSAETEEITDRGKLAPSTVAQRDRAEALLYDEFPDVSPQRVRHQVNRFMMRERGRVWREQQGK